jgi:hypothetical protein
MCWGVPIGRRHPAGRTYAAAALPSPLPGYVGRDLKAHAQASDAPAVVRARVPECLVVPRAAVDPGRAFGPTDFKLPGPAPLQGFGAQVLEVFPVKLQRELDD